MNLNYFFNDIKEFPYPEIFDGTNNPWEVIMRAHELIRKEVVDKNLAINNGIMKGQVYIEGNHFIGKNTVIHNGVTILGPVIIGENCDISSGALIRPFTVIGDNCVIGHSAVIQNSVVANGAKQQHLTFVGDSILGKGARIGSGAILANRRFDQKKVMVKFEGGKVELDTTKFGAVIGDYARIGANATLQPGTLVGAYSWIFPGVNAYGFIPEAKRVFYDKTFSMCDNEKINLE